ncbi:hypothetical protein CLOM_g3172 [Closterium sp. NIES-68]|nr:hypothetical protein CLOM_g3172 [Closterium sp. NIES-68]GJP43754.1 hypothetical protein CLOM_g3172 [Closterium sp. NIES-68]
MLAVRGDGARPGAEGDAADDSDTWCARLQLTADSESSGLYVLSRWGEAECELTASDGRTAWTCCVEEERMGEKAEAWGFQTPGEYNRDVLQAVLRQPPSALRFTWGRRSKRARANQDQPATWQLSWPVRRSDLELRATLEFRAVEGEEQQRAAVAGILDRALTVAAAAQASCGVHGIVGQAEQQRSREACERLLREADKCLQQSDRFKEEKGRLEDELLGKFLAVLNAKKARIRKLEAAQGGGTAGGTGGGGAKGGSAGGKGAASIGGAGGAGRAGKGR